MVVTEKFIRAADPYRWKKGQVPNPKGRPKGVSSTTILKKLLQGKLTYEEDKKKIKKSVLEIILLKAIKDAIDPRNSASERTQARESILNRLEGKPVQPLGVAPETPINIVISSIEDKL